MVATKHKGLTVLVMRAPSRWHRWLEKHHGRDEGVWLKFAKKASPEKTISYEQAREAAICWGWIDGLINKWDEDYYVIRFTRRRRRSIWSKINVRIVEDLIARGLMQPPGMVEVEAAKADGRWDAAYGKDVD